MLPVTDGGPDHVDNYLYALGGSFNMSISNKFDCFNCYMAGLIKAEKAVAVALRVAATTHKQRANANCFYVVQQWATGGSLFGITVTHGRMDCRGRTLVRAVDLLAAQATSVFNMIVRQEVGRGYTRAGAP